MAAIGASTIRPLPTVGSRIRRPRRLPAACRAQGRSYPPMGKPFSRTPAERLIPEPTRLQKFKNELADHCCRLEGEECCSCWDAYFEFDKIEEKSRKFAESIISWDMNFKSLIPLLHRLAARGIGGLGKEKEAQDPLTAPVVAAEERQMPYVAPEEKQRPFPVPDGLPKTQEELEEEERALMPDSDWTRMLRRFGRRQDDTLPCSITESLPDRGSGRISWARFNLGL